MKKSLFHDDWKVAKIEPGILGQHIMGYPEGEPVMLPHDAMIGEKRNPACKNGDSTGFYPGGIYRYQKRFFVPEEWKEKTVSLEFEGSYGITYVNLNGDYMGTGVNGYTDFRIPLDKGLLYGEENEIEEDVAVMVVEGQIENETHRNRSIRIFTKIFAPDGKLAAEEINRAMIYGHTKSYVKQRITLKAPVLWSPERPALYRCEFQVLEDGEETDRETIQCGIRKLSLDAERCLRLNGQEIKLRGACIHHDNGIIGVCTLPKAEERRCRLLKEAGFNCLRSSHHLMGKAMLEACDRLGMLVMDEISDMWEHPKNINDYAAYFPKCWEEDVEKMVAKDYNHPCVILYSTGNEIQEVGTSKGAA